MAWAHTPMAGAQPGPCSPAHPTAAALFRDQINTHPVLSRYFQANSLLPAVMVGGAAMGLLGEPQG